jgi:hypothetical protein
MIERFDVDSVPMPKTEEPLRYYQEDKENKDFD